MKYMKLLVLIRQSSKVGYSEAPRHFVISGRDKHPTKWSSLNHLEAIHVWVKDRLQDFLPTKSSQLLIWLVDEPTNEPLLFLTGLLEVRRGKRTHADAAAWNERLLPQVTSKQAMRSVEVELSATAELTFFPDFDECEEYGEEDAAADLIETDCGELDEWSITYAERDDDALLVNADVCHRMTVDVPWKAGKPLTKVQEKYLEAMAKDEIEDLWCGGEARLANVKCEIVADAMAEAA